MTPSEPLRFLVDPEFPDLEVVELAPFGRDPGYMQTHNGQDVIHQPFWSIKRLPAIDSIYKPLAAADSIRVLHLDPAPTRDVPLSGSFSIASLSSRPNYRALSYVGGRATRIAAITCDGQELRITSNLASALTAIRSPSNVVRLWVDALCINQDQLAEKNHQVRNMGAIYRNAERVLVWLGQDRARSAERAFAIARNISESLDFRAAYLNAWKRNTVSSDALKELTYAEWFHRTWTFQEIALATTATFMMGNESIDLDTLYHAFQLIEDHVGLLKLKQLGFHTDRVTFSKKAYSYQSFKDVIIHTNERSSSNPRDRIYALLSHPKALDPRTGKQVIEVDYAKPVARVYAEAMLVILREAGDLRDLSYAFHAQGKASDGWPSWVANWRHNPPLAWLLGGSPQAFAACGKYTVHNPRLYQHRWRGQTLLRVEGFVFDNIVELCDWDLPLQSRSQFIYRVWRNIVEPAQRFYGNRALKAIRLSLTALQKDKNRKDEVLENEWLACWDDYIPARQRSTVASRASQECQRRAADEIWEKYFTLLQKKVLFVTKRGLVGMAQSGVKVGDDITILSGGPIPYALRMGDGRNKWIDGIRGFHLISECYVAELMDGQIDHLASQWGLKQEPIYLL